MDDVDMDAAVEAVIADMGEAARRFKSQRYAPKPKPEAAPEQPKAEEAEPQVSLGELESMLNGG